uniref:Anthranilate N-benzoyltransferase protein 1 n=1 Tax=Aegilops tauschii subsp. strangulata TaxID=200361 RepID=A0A453DUU0_AEGTS|nr:tryptamine benzoyltransferase 1-like [Aegilops tauschii subsp. strangulata]
MEIITSSRMLKPVYSTPHPLLGEKVQLTVFDRAALDIFVPVVVAYPAPTPSNEAIKEGLLRAVAPYPHLAGRLAADHRGRRFLHVNNEGVLVVEATVSSNLADLLAYGGMAADVHGQYHTLPEGNVGEALLQIKLNRCKCGGLVVGVSYHHQTADGVAMNNFFITWETAVRQGKDFVAPTPFLDRATTAVSRRMPAPVFDHQSIEFKSGESRGCTRECGDVVSMVKIKDVRVHLTTEFLTELRARVGGRCSMFQCLLAHVWKKITAARALKPEEFTQVKVAVNCRGRAKPPVPMDFFGNMVLWAFPRLQVRDVLNWSYRAVVGAIRDAVARIDDEYIQSFVDFGSLADANGKELMATAAAGTTLCPDAEVDTWLGFRYHQLDFGTGPPCAFQPPDLPIEGLMVFVPSCTAGGGVDLFMAVAEDHVEAFEKICYSLDDDFPTSSRM